VDVRNGGLTVDGPVDAEGHLRTNGGLILIDGVAELAGDVISVGSGITYTDDVTADGAGDQTFDAEAGTLTANDNVDITKTTPGALDLIAGDDVVVRNVTVQLGPLNIEAGDYVWLLGDIWSRDKTTLLFNAGQNITLQQEAEIKGDLIMTAGSDVWAYGDLDAGGDIEITSAWVDTTYLLNDYVVADGSISLTGDTRAASDIRAGQDVTANDQLYLIGGWFEGDYYGHEDQTVQAENGTLTANSWVRQAPAVATSGLKAKVTCKSAVI